jgi:hypothetical protein
MCAVGCFALRQATRLSTKRYYRQKAILPKLTTKKFPCELHRKLYATGYSCMQPAIKDETSTLLADRSMMVSNR